MMIGQLIVCGKLVEYSGPEAPKAFQLADDMEIVPWDHPRLFLLTIKGVPVAGPARREILESFVHDLNTNPEKAKELSEIRREVERVIKVGSV